MVTSLGNIQKNLQVYENSVRQMSVACTIGQACNNPTVYVQVQLIILQYTSSTMNFVLKIYQSGFIEAHRVKGKNIFPWALNNLYINTHTHTQSK